MKTIRVIRIILIVIVVGLLIAIMATEAYTKADATTLSIYLSLGLSTFFMFNGLYEYKENKKTASIMFFITGFLMLLTEVMKHI